MVSSMNDVEKKQKRKAGSLLLASGALAFAARRAEAQSWDEALLKVGAMVFAVAGFLIYNKMNKARAAAEAKASEEVAAKAKAEAED